MKKFWKRGMTHAQDAPVRDAPDAFGRAQGVLSRRTTTALQGGKPFRLVRNFSLASFTAFLLFAAALLYFEHLENDFVKQVHQEQNGFFARLQDSFLQRHDPAAGAFLLGAYEAGNINLGRLFSNAMWEKDFAPFVAKAQRVPVDQCRAIADVKDAGGRTVQPGGKQACYAGIGRQIVALPGFRGLDARVFDTMKKSTVFKIKLYDLRGITVYSSEHSQIGEDKTGDAGWVSAAAGRPASALVHRDRFSAFEGVVVDRDLVTTYLPMIAPGSETIAGVLEVYSDVTPFLEQINSTSSEIRALIAANKGRLERAAAANQQKVDASQKMLLAAMFGTLALLYLALYLIVSNAQRIIDRQDLERGRALEALRDSHARTQLLVESSNIGLWDWDLLTNEVYFSPQWKQHIGHADHELPNRYEEWESRLHPEDRERTLTAVMDFRDGRRADYEVEFRLRHKHGSWRWILTRADLVRDAAGRPVRMMGCHIDITERKRAEQALQDSERLLRESQSIAGLGSYVLDIPADRWRGSPVLDDILGIDDNFERSVAGWLSLMHPEWREQMSRYFADEVLGKHVRFDREYRIIRKTDGEARWVHGLGELEFDAQGRPCRMIGTISDITERKRAEEALRAAEAQFRSLVEQSIAGAYIIQDGRFTYVNPRFAEIFGYASAEEVIACDVSSLVAEKDRDKVAQNVRKRMEGEVATPNYDFAGLRKDGSMIDVGVHGGRATHNGRPAVIGLMQDISEKKRAEEQIRHYVAQLETAFMSTVVVATTLSEMRDPYTAGHERRVAEIAVAIGAELGFDARRQEGLRVAGYLHDIGKITIPSEILSKPGRLSPIEFKLIQGHSQASYDVLKAVEFPWPVADVALQHHERINGSGYPQGLKGDAILLEARIMAVADVIEAMSSHRPYRAGLGIEAALGEIERGRGTSYDPVVADACLKLFREKGYAVPA